MSRSFPIALAVLAALSVQIARAADDIHAHADRVSGQVKGKGQDVVVLEGNVLVTHGKTTIAADRAVYDKEAGSLVFTGTVRLAHEGVAVEARELVYLRRTKEGTFRGDVRLSRSEEKGADGKAAKDAFALTCAELVFAAEKNDFTARGQAALVHKDFSATADEIVYDDEHQELKLSGEPQLIHKDETIKASEIVISVENDTFRIVKAEITFIVEEKSGGTEPAGTDAAATTGGNMPPAT